MFSNVKEFEKLGLEINTNGYKSYTTCKVDRFGTDPSKRKAGTVGCTMGSGEVLYLIPKLENHLIALSTD